MRRFLPTILLLGYAMLVPFCFFGSEIAANMHTVNMTGGPTHQMADCGTPMAGCAHATDTGVMGLIAHHVGMYLSISQVPLSALSMLLALAVIFFLIILVLHRFRDHLPERSFSRALRRVKDAPRNGSPQHLLTWLSLFETSPTFA